MSIKKYTDEHINFLREYGATHTIDEMWEAFFDKFEMDVSLTSIKNLVQYYHIPHLTKRGIAGNAKTICTRGEKSSTKNYAEYRRTQISGTEELMCLINDVCTLYDIKKYEFYTDALKLFVKGEFPVSDILKSTKHFENAKQINVDIPLILEDDINNIAKQNNCASNKVIFQAIVNYGTNKLPSKKSEFNDFITTKTSAKSQTDTIPNKKSVISNNTATSKTTTTSCVYHRYTDEEIDYLKSIAPDYNYDEVTDLFNKRFGFDFAPHRIQKCLCNHGIQIGKRKNSAKKSTTSEDAKKVIDTIPEKNLKYYVEGMDEVKFKKDESDDSKDVDSKEELDSMATPRKVDYNRKDTVPDNVPSLTESINQLQNGYDDLSNTFTCDTDTTSKDTSVSKQAKRYVIPQDVPKIIERIRKITTASRFEICNCAIKYYLSKKWHVDKRLKVSKYYDPSWLNTKFVQPIMITFDMMNQLEKVANEFHCKISAVIIQAYLDYSSKIFDDCSIEFNYVFESDTYKDK